MFSPVSNANVPLPTESPLLHTGMHFFMQSFSYFITCPSTMLGRWWGLLQPVSPPFFCRVILNRKGKKPDFSLTYSCCQNYCFPHTQSTWKDTGQLQAIPKKKKKSKKKVFPSTAALLSLTTSHDTSIPILSRGGAEM